MIFPVAGRNGSPKSDPKRCGCMTSRIRSWARVAPYEVYDLGANQGWVSVG